MPTGKKVGRDAIHCSTSRYARRDGAAPAEFGVGTVSPVWDCFPLLWSAPVVHLDQPPRRGTLCWSEGGPNKGSTSGQDGDVHLRDDSNGGFVGWSTCIEGENEGSGTFLISNRGEKAKGWASRY